MTGLRERKKAKTREALQAHALRLFRDQGYEETTIEQIAAAAEVSPSTLFRYFPSKEDLVIYDALDPYAFEMYAHQPAELSPVQALRATLHELFKNAPPEVIEAQLQRERLARTVPAVKVKMLDGMMTSGQMMSEVLAKRVGRPATDPAVAALAGAVVGIAMLAWAQEREAITADGLPAYLHVMDAYLAQLDAGFASLAAPSKAKATTTTPLATTTTATHATTATTHPMPTTATTHPMPTTATTHATPPTTHATPTTTTTHATTATTATKKAAKRNVRRSSAKRARR